MRALASAWVMHLVLLLCCTLSYAAKRDGGGLPNRSSMGSSPSSDFHATAIIQATTESEDRVTQAIKSTSSAIMDSEARITQAITNSGASFSSAVITNTSLYGDTRPVKGIEVSSFRLGC